MVYPTRLIHYSAVRGFFRHIRTISRALWRTSGLITCTPYPGNCWLIDPKELQLIRLQADEMWSFVGRKSAKQWIWVIYWPELKQVLAYHVGGRSKQDA